MSVDPKSHLVSFRLTADEYYRLRDLCLSQGLGSVSEMARAALHTLMQNPSDAAKRSLEERVADLEVRLKFLGADVRKLQSP